jgi:hypothetical protein
MEPHSPRNIRNVADIEEVEYLVQNQVWSEKIEDWKRNRKNRN